MLLPCQLASTSTEQAVGQLRVLPAPQDLCVGWTRHGHACRLYKSAGQQQHTLIRSHFEVSSPQASAPGSARLLCRIEGRPLLRER